MKTLLLFLGAGFMPVGLSGQLVLNEFLADPAADLTGDANGDGVRESGNDEFIELVNTSGSAVDIGGWTISDAVSLRHTFLGSTMIEDGQAVLVFGGGAPTGSFGGSFVTSSSEGGLGLNNSGDTTEGNGNTSLTLDPDLTGTSYVQHATLGDASLVFSPGTQNDGALFLGEALSLRVDPATFSEGAGVGAASGTVTRSGDLSAILTVTLESDDVTELTVPPSVDIPAGEASAMFMVTAVDDVDSDGMQSVSIRASDPAEEFLAAEVSVVVMDDEAFELPAIVINELRTDNFEVDTEEYVEIYSATADFSLDRVWLVVLGDSGPDDTSGVVERAFDLNGQSATGNYFLLGNSNMTTATSDLAVGTNIFENGDSLTFLLVTEFTGSAGEDLDMDNDGVLDVEPWGEVIDAVSIVEPGDAPSSVGFAYAESLGFTGADVTSDTGFVPAHIFRSPDGAGALFAGPFGSEEEPAIDSPGAENGDVEGSPPEEDLEIIAFSIDADTGVAQMRVRGAGSRVLLLQRSDDLNQLDAWTNVNGGFSESDHPDGSMTLSFAGAFSTVSKRFYRLIEQP